MRNKSLLQWAKPNSQRNQQLQVASTGQRTHQQVVEGNGKTVGPVVGFVHFIWHNHFTGLLWHARVTTECENEVGSRRENARRRLACASSTRKKEGCLRSFLVTTFTQSPNIVQTLHGALDSRIAQVCLRGSRTSVYVPSKQV